MSTRVCDICNASGGGTFVGAPQMRDAVDGGFDPYVRGITMPPPWDTAPHAVREEHVRRWKRRVEADTSDWDLCPACFAAFRRYVAEEPAPLGVKESLVPSSESYDDTPPTILDELIALGVYRHQAGTEAIGHFDPGCTPFLVFAGESGGTGPRIGLNPDAAGTLLTRLRLANAGDLIPCFGLVRGNPDVRKLPWTTTLEPFIDRYSVGPKRGIAEVMMQLEMNALSRLLLHEPAFAAVSSPDAFLRAAVLFARH